ncbi:MAG: PAS domain S-box protein [Anaerolineales bacterium]|nr:PAS domain S-box protein [Anaerolineales bacterium]
MDRIASQRSWLVRGWPAVVFLALVIYAVLIVSIQGSMASRVIGTLGLVVAFSGAGYCALRASRRIQEPTIRLTWIFLGVGLILWAAASAIDGITWIIDGALPEIPAVGDVLRTAGSLAAFAALVIYPASPQRGFGRIRILLDISVIILGTVTLFWLIFLQPVIEVGIAEVIPAIWALLRGAFNLTFYVLILRLIFLANERREGTAFISLSVSFLIMTVADLMYGFQRLGVQAGTPEAVVFGWMLACLFVGVASQFRLGIGLGEEMDVESRENPWGKRIEAILPIAVAYVLVVYVAVDWWLSGELNDLAFQSIILMSLLLIGRQGVIAGQSEMRQYAELVNSTADLAFICDSSGFIRFTNPSFQEALGVELDPSQPINIDDHLAMNTSFDDIRRHVSEDGWVGEVELKTEDGVEIPVSMSITPIPIEGRRKEQLYAATAHDLADAKAREQELRSALGQLAEAQDDLKRLNVELEAKVEERTQELENLVANLEELNEELKALDKMKTEFVALVSHELRAPLTNIRTGLEVALQGYPDMETGLNETMRLVMVETERLGGFVETILDLSALEAGRFPLQIKSVSLPEIIEEVTFRFSQQRNVERIKVQIPGDLPHIEADDQALHSVLFHLIDNALKYASEGDVVISAYDEDAMIHMRVVDSGPGIPPEERDQVFQMFYRLDSSDSRTIYGRGLGLHLAHRFLEVMRGEIKIGEAEKGGTQVDVWLPKRA